MSQAEYDSGMKFTRRYKWFSQDLNFICQRVCDGLFNNSKYKADRYTVLVSCQITKEHLRKATQINIREIMIDRRANVRFYNVRQITQKEN